jgi:hypothetical protein
MGEIADMMLDGTMCECCGEFMGSEGEGFPRYCSEECAKNRGVDFQEQDEEEPCIEDIYNYLQIALSSIGLALDTAKDLKLKHRIKELKYIMMKVQLYMHNFEG